MIQVDSPMGKFVVSDGLIVARNPALKKVFDMVAKEPVEVYDGDQDSILVDRMITTLGGGSKIIAIAEEPVDPDIVY
ncbi:MAG: hypothetical protein PF503_06290 [Desulfobacula sp.]|jgi:hypothetical protein|nr:hypothetical protein [Desulfobacula sp.]